MNEKEIAQTILQQSQCPNKMIFFSWGSNQYTVLPKGKMGENYTLGGLSMKVRGNLLKGRVEVFLMANDTYTVRFFNIRYRMLKEYTDIYCDQLQEIIDNNVEKIKEYQY